MIFPRSSRRRASNSATSSSEASSPLRSSTWIVPCTAFSTRLGSSAKVRAHASHSSDVLGPNDDTGSTLGALIRELLELRDQIARRLHAAIRSAGDVVEALRGSFELTEELLE